MARITITICLFSIFSLSHFALPSQASMVFILDDLPFSIDEVLLIPESEHDWCGEQYDPPWQKFIFPACRIADPGMIPNRATVLQYDVATCPIESEAALETVIDDDSAASRLSRRAVWAVASNSFSARKAIIINSLESIERTFCECCQSVSQSANQTLRSISWGDVQKTSITSARKLVPSILMSHHQSAWESDPILSPEVIFEEANKIGSEASGESLRGFSGTTQDSYWQYYEDCDRWDVDFANLLMEADITVPSREIEEEAIEESQVHGISPHCLILQLVAAQNLSIWLYRSPRIERQTSVDVSRWMEFVKSSYLEGAETVLASVVPTASPNNADHHRFDWLMSPTGFVQRTKPFSAGWKFISEIIHSE